MSYYVGQKVVCISTETFGNHFYSADVMPTLNSIYTIRRIILPEEVGRWATCAAIWVEEIHNPPHLFMTGSGMRVVEQCFDIDHFRPLIERKTDISTFKQLLNPTNPKVLEPVE